MSLWERKPILSMFLIYFSRSTSAGVDKPNFFFFKVVKRYREMPIENVLIVLLNVSLKEMMSKNIAFLHFFDSEGANCSEIQRNIKRTSRWPLPTLALRTDYTMYCFIVVLNYLSISVFRLCWSYTVQMKLFLSCSGLSGGFNFVLVYFFEYYFAFFGIICMLY